MEQESTLEALSAFAEATQDLATAGVERSIGRAFASVDFCNQSAEKSLQAVSIARTGHRAPYDHDLRALGSLLDVPPELLAVLEALTPFHPEAFHAHTAPELADDVVTDEQVEASIVGARRIQRWARAIVFSTTA